MKAAILVIGNEILSGATRDTNSGFIAQQLISIGVECKKIIAVEDDPDIIVDTLDYLFETHDILFTTGGLGPTKDDLTKTVLCKYFGDELVLHQPTLDNIEQMFAKLNRTMNELNRRQAMVPSKAKIFINKRGTAPGMWMEKNGKILVSLPGVPYELEDLVQFSVIPYIRERFDLPIIFSDFATVNGIPESLLAERLSNWEQTIPNDLQLAYLPTGGRVKVKLTTKGNSLDECKNRVHQYLDQLPEILGEAVVSVYSENAEELLVDFLLEKGLSISTAESCTGGVLASMFTTRAGASLYYRGGIIPYQTPMKDNLLGVPQEVLEQFSAVSEETAMAMAEQIAAKTASDIAISTTGVAGPAKDEAEHEVGLAFVGVQMNGKTFVRRYFFPHLPRVEFQRRISRLAIDFCWECVKQSFNQKD